VQKNDLLEVTIDSLAFGGAGVARHDGKAVFVTGGFPGDRALVRIDKSKKRHMESTLAKLLNPSPDRVEPNCPHAHLCGGCPWIGYAYEKQLEWKKRIVAETLRRIGRIECPPKKVVAPGAPFGYRSRVRMGVNSEGRLCYHQRGSNDLTPIDSCSIATDGVNRIMAELSRAISSSEELSGGIDEVSIETGDTKARADLLLSSPIPPDALQKLLDETPSLTGMSARYYGKKKLFGEPDIDVRQGEESTLMYGPKTFGQANRQGERHIIDRVSRLLDLGPQDTLLDLYCGVGNYSVALAQQGVHVTGVDRGGANISAARQNFKQGGLTAGRFIEGDAAKETERLAAGGSLFSAVLTNPPREGMAKAVSLAAVVATERVVYVSCDPASLARDAALLREEEFTLRSVEPVDLFGQTSHIETVSLFVRDEGSD